MFQLADRNASHELGRSGSVELLRRRTDCQRTRCLLVQGECSDRFEGLLRVVDNLAEALLGMREYSEIELCRYNTVEAEQLLLH